MAANSEFPLSLIIRAIDKATAPLRAINAQINKVTEPVRAFGASFKKIGEESGLTQLGERVGHVGHAVHEVGKSLVETAKKFLELEAVGGFALYEIAHKSIEAGSDLKNMAERVGLTVDEYAQLRFAAQQAHVPQEQFSKSMDMFARNVGEAKAQTGQLYEFLLKVSPALANQVVHAKDVGSALHLMIGALSQIPDKTKRAALANEAFGRGAAQLALFFGQGNKAIDAQKRKYFELAGSQAKFADEADESEKSLNEVSAAFDGLRSAAITPLFPVLRELAESLAKVIGNNRGNLQKWAEETGAAIRKWVEGGGLTRLVDDLGKIAKAVIAVVDHLGGLKGVMIGVSLFMSADLIKNVIGLGSALWGVVPAILRVGGTLAGLAFGPIVAAIGNFVIALRAGYSAMAALNLVMAANPVGAVIVGLTALAGLAYVIYKNWQPIKQFFVELWEVIKHPLDALDKFKHSTISTPAAPVFGMGAARPSLGAAAIASPFPRGGVVRNDARVTVDFQNVPRGTKVAVDPRSKAPVDTSVGVAMQGAGA